MKKNQYMALCYSVIVFFRLLVPSLIFFYPLFSIILTLFLDLIDGEFASRRALTISQYQTNDKLLDLWGNLFQLSYSFFYLKQYFIIFLILFVYRLTGQMIFLLTNKRKMLVFFPNYFEALFLTVFFAFHTKQLSFLLEKQNLIFVLAAIFIIKVIQEWWLHWAHLSVCELVTGRKKQWLKD